MSLEFLKQSSGSRTRTKVFEDPDHIDSVLEIFEKFYHEQKYLDIDLIAAIDNVKVKAHRIVISATSDYFMALFSSPLKDANANAHEIELENIDGVTLQSIIEFIYSGTMLLTSETVQSVLIAADFLQIIKLKEACCEFLYESVDFDNCLDIAVFADNFNHYKLSQEAYSIALHNLVKLGNGKDFLEINHEHFMKLISSKEEDDSSINEETIFLSIASWVDHDRANREPFLFDILTLVEFQRLTPRFIIENRHSVCQSIECYELILSWIEWHLLSDPNESSKHIYKKKNVLLIIPGGMSTDELKAPMFKPQLNWWSNFDIPSSPVVKDNFSAAVINEMLIIVGGRTVNDNIYSSSSSVECFLLETMEWAILPPMQQERQQCAVTVVNNEIYAIGGYSGENILNSVEKYNFSLKKWRYVAPLFKTMHIGEATVLNGIIYAIDVSNGLMQSYDPFTNEWSLKSIKQQASRYFGVASEFGYLYTVGGCINKIPTNTVERYDPIDNTWSFMAPMKFARTGVKCAFRNNRLIACAGRDDDGLTNRVEEYNPRTNEWKAFAPLLNPIDGRSNILSY